jgi:hypothetical protein
MTMTTVGYGDIVPETVSEVLTCIAGMIVGGFVFGLIVGNLSELSKRANAGELMRQKAASQANAMLNTGEIKSMLTQSTGRRIKAYYSNFFDRRGAWRTPHARALACRAVPLPLPLPLPTPSCPAPSRPALSPTCQPASQPRIHLGRGRSIDRVPSGVGSLAPLLAS